MTPEEILDAAKGYRRSGMPWREIGARLGVDKDVLRRKLSELGYADGWGEGSVLKSVESTFGVASQIISCGKK